MEERIGAIIMYTIVIHTTIGTAAKSELFGLLGDAPTQRLDAFFGSHRGVRVYTKLSKRLSSIIQNHLEEDARRRVPISRF